MPFVALVVDKPRMLPRWKFFDHILPHWSDPELRIFYLRYKRGKRPGNPLFLKVPFSASVFVG